MFLPVTVLRGHVSYYNTTYVRKKQFHIRIKI